MKEQVSGTTALAIGAIEAGVSFVTGYPGSPVTAVVDAIIQSTSAEEVHAEWNSNEKVAIEMAFGASLGGKRSLLCTKSVGLNIALDPLMTLNLAGNNAGLVILVGDDPGGWASQNEQDSRALCTAAELPTLEPTTVSDARGAMRYAFQLSEDVGLPVFVRFTRALALAQGEILSTDNAAFEAFAGLAPPPFKREFMRWVVLPFNVVDRHRRLHQRLDEVQGRFEDSPFNSVAGNGPHGVIAAGFAFQKLSDLLGDSVPRGLRVLRLGTFYPLPVNRVTTFLREVESVHVLEETAPLVERAVRALAQRAGLTLPVYGSDTGHVDCVGELSAANIAHALKAVLPGLTKSVGEESERPMPSRKPLCEGCPYIPTFDALLEVLAKLGGRDEYIITGETGCQVRGQLPPYELLDAKIILGSSIGIAAGLALSQHSESGQRKRVVALSGDSSLLHTGLQGLMDAARMGASMLVLLLDNGTTALTGGQAHAASRTDSRGRAQPPIDLARLCCEVGAGWVRTVDLDRGEDIRSAIESGLFHDGVAVVIARGRCPQWAEAG